MQSALILLVEDDRELCSLVRRGLGEEGYDVRCAATGSEAMAMVAAKRPAAVVIDVGLPDADGRDLCQAMRAQGFQAPVLFLTARDALPDRLAGFRAGGDDYIVKPFSMAELAARLGAVLQRAGGEGELAHGGLTLDPSSHEVCVADHRTRLTPTEFRLLAALAAASGEAVSRRALIRTGWPEGAVVHDNTIDVYLARLRRKLRELPGAPAIATLHGVGYRLR